MSLSYFFSPSVLFLMMLLAAATPVRAAEERCCVIIAIDMSGMVQARDVDSNGTFRFEVEDKDLLTKLTVGQQIDANFKTGQVWIDPQQPCCRIVRPPDTSVCDILKSPLC